MSLTIFVQGIGLGLSMIMPIGLQNAYMLNQGIKKDHHIMTATVFSILDVLFISLGIFGGGALLSKNTTILQGITIAGILFVCYYGLLSLRSALFPSQSQQEHQEASSRGRKAVLLGALAVTLLNPHLYLDTLVILGSIGGQFEGADRTSFALGTICASFIWFYTLSFTAAKMSSILSKPKVQRGIDVGVALFMFGIAFFLYQSLVQLN